MRVLKESFGRDCPLSDFCESRNVPVQTYYRWLAEYNKEREAEKEAASASVDELLPWSKEDPDTAKAIRKASR